LFRFSKATRKRWGAQDAHLLNSVERSIEHLAGLTTKSVGLPRLDDPVVAVNEYLAFSRTCYAVKLGDLYAVAGHCIDFQSYGVLALCVRGIVENAAVLHHFVQDPELTALHVSWRQGTSTPAQMQTAVNRTDQLMRGNMFAWDALVSGEHGDMVARPSDGTVSQVRVAKTALKALYVDVPDAKLLYDMLSDLVHPNLGSNMAVLSSEQGRPVVGGGGKRAGLSLGKVVTAGARRIFEATIEPDLLRLKSLELNLGWDSH
jgi:hypothetical protein